MNLEAAKLNGAFLIPQIKNFRYCAWIKIRKARDF